MNRGYQLLIAMAAVVFVFLVLEFAVIDRPRMHEATVWGGNVPFYWLGFGFLATVVIEIVSVWLGSSFLQRVKDPYLVPDLPYQGEGDLPEHRETPEPLDEPEPENKPEAASDE